MYTRARWNSTHFPLLAKHEKLTMKINYDKITSLSAIIVAVAAVFVAVYEANVIRDFQEISVWPHLSAYTTDIENKLPKTNFSFWLKNDGIGPALVKNIQYIYKGKQYSDMAELSKAIFPEENIPSMKSDKSTLKVLLPGKEALLFAANFSESHREKYFKSVVDHFDFKVCFCSLYKKCWQLDNRNNVNEVRHCKESS